MISVLFIFHYKIVTEGGGVGGGVLGPPVRHRATTHTLILKLPSFRERKKVSCWIGWRYLLGEVVVLVMGHAGGDMVNDLSR